MVATAEALTGRTVRVYCITHKVGFDAQADKSLVCARADHELAKQFPDDSTWEYCCDCQHCWLVDTAKQEAASKECPACEREIVRRYACAGCNVISLESNEPARRKVFTLSGGAPSPTCPGCLKTPPRIAIDHDCPDYGVRFVTSFSQCPFCDQVLESAPEFPCTVAACLASLKRTPTQLRFESKTSELKAAADGDYLLVPSVPGVSLALVIPAMKQLKSKRDYYDTYYELFNCENPLGGEIVVVRPATAQKTETGWVVNEPGTIEIKAAPPEVRAVGATCANCGTLGKPSEQFCGRCGVAFSATPARPQPAEVVAPPAALPRGNRNTNSPYRPTPPASATATTIHAPAYDFGSSATAQAASKMPPTSKAAKVVLSLVSGLFLLVVIVALIGNGLGGKSVEKQLDQAITRGNLFPPATENAHDLYNQLKANNASEDTLRKYRERIIPLLTNQPTQLIQSLMQPGYDEAAASEWQMAARNMLWAAELMPSDKGVSAKAAYCQGRVAYLEKRDQDAIENWRRAAQLDSTWALPLNSAGLVYASEKNYAAARSLYFDAVRRNPQWANPYNNLGTSYYMEKDYSDAKEYYHKAVQIAPDWARPHAWLGDIAMNEKDFATAITEYEAVLSPKAIGTGNMNLDKIKQKLADAQRLSSTPVD